jgi:AraC family transcriptional regulator
LDPAFVNGVEEELDHRPAEELHFRANINDLPMRQLITLLVAEAGQGGTLGRLYADHLAHAVAVRLFFTGAAGKRRTHAGASGLPRRLMRRVLERMHDFGSNLDLQTLAAETGYSRSHFLRMFRASTGVPPHRYLLHLRLERAKKLIRLPHTSLIDVAAACGFSSHAHMARAFRQLLGMTPSEYRHNL